MSKIFKCLKLTWGISKPIFSHPLEVSFLLALPFAVLIPFYLSDHAENPALSKLLLGVYTLMVLASGYNFGVLQEKLATAKHKAKRGE
jgi:hypothetical protein